MKEKISIDLLDNLNVANYYIRSLLSLAQQQATINELSSEMHSILHFIEQQSDLIAHDLKEAVVIESEEDEEN